MSDLSIPHGGHGSVGPLSRLSGSTPPVNGVLRHGEPSTASERVGPADRVELSSFARYMDMLRQVTPQQLERVSESRIEQARLAIQNGEYDTDEILDATIERLMDDLV